MLSQRHGYAALSPLPPTLRQSCVLSIIFQGDIFLADHWPPGPGVCSTRQTTTSSSPWAPPVALVNSRTQCALAKRKHGDLFLCRCCPRACVQLSLVLLKHTINARACSECWEKSEMISLRCLGGGVLKEGTCVLRGLCFTSALFTEIECVHLHYCMCYKSGLEIRPEKSAVFVLTPLFRWFIWCK